MWCAMPPTRRTFLTQASIAAAGLALERSAHAAGGDTLKLALVGCGGRGTGAASQALSAEKGVKLVAMADLFPERLELSYKTLQAAHEDQVSVSDSAKFIGFDAYKEAIALADVVICTTSPGFRVLHFEEAVRQGKHCFLEKPVAVDAPGVRRALAAAAEAKKKKLAVGCGFQRHHQPAYLEALEKVRSGAIGDIESMSVYWLGNSRAGLVREPGESELHYQMRNWYFFTWLSGDHIVEQHCHNIDAALWFKGAHPIRAQGMGGRQVRTSRETGQIFDHHFVEYEFEDGTRLYSQSRQGQVGAFAKVGERIEGTKGVLDTTRFVITGANPWRYKDAKGGAKDAYQFEHNDLFAAIRAGTDYNEVERSATSTMTAIMGRMATYSGKQIEWEQAFNSQLELGPRVVTWETDPPVKPGADGFYPVAMPGRTVAL